MSANVQLRYVEVGLWPTPSGTNSPLSCYQGEGALQILSTDTVSMVKWRFLARTGRLLVDLRYRGLALPDDKVVNDLVPEFDEALTEEGVHPRFTALVLPENILLTVEADLGKGRKTSLRLQQKPSDTVADVLTAVEAGLGHNGGSMVLIGEGTKLGRLKQLKHLKGLACAMTLQAVPADEHGINIFVKSLSGKTFTVHGLSCSDTVDTIMEAVEDKEGVLNLFDEQRLVFAGQQLETGRTLYEHRIQNDSTLHMMGRLRGGSSSLAPLKIPFADVSKTSAIQHIRFSPDAPSWRTVVTGLNLEGYCRNPRCAARNELVIANVGMDAFTLGARCACPQCSSAILPHTCGFYACTWKYEGAKTDGVFMCSPWYTAGDTAYDLVNEHGNMALWSRLVLVAKPIASGAKDKDGRAVPNDCGLCLMSLAESENTAVRNCGHRYHATCLTRWQQQYSGGSHRSTCPACRAQHHGASASA